MERCNCGYFDYTEDDCISELAASVNDVLLEFQDLKRLYKAIYAENAMLKSENAKLKKILRDVYVEDQ